MATNNQIIGIVTEVPMGDWNATTPYQKLNTVRHNGATYKARKGNRGIEPSVAQGWQEFWMLMVKDSLPLAQSTGNSTEVAMSQNAVTEGLKTANSNLQNHINDESNPHNVTKAQVGLGRADNTPDSEKYVYHATRANQDENGNIINETYIPKINQINSGSLNDVKETGLYGITNAVTERPTTNDGYLQVIHFGEKSEMFCAQIFHGGAGGTLYVRTNNSATGNAWSSWRTIITNDVLGSAAKKNAANTLTPTATTLPTCAAVWNYFGTPVREGVGGSGVFKLTLGKKYLLWCEAGDNDMCQFVALPTELTRPLLLPLGFSPYNHFDVIKIFTDGTAQYGYFETRSFPTTGDPIMGTAPIHYREYN